MQTIQRLVAYLDFFLLFFVFRFVLWSVSSEFALKQSQIEPSHKLATCVIDINLMIENFWSHLVLSASVRHAWVLLLFLISTKTNTWSKLFQYSLVLMLETYYNPDNGNYSHCCCWSNSLDCFILPILSLLFALFLFCRMVGISWF